LRYIYMNPHNVIEGPGHLHYQFRIGSASRNNRQILKIPRYGYVNLILLITMRFTPYIITRLKYIKQEQNFIIVYCCCTMVSQWMGHQSLLYRAPPCFGRHVKLLVPPTFAFDSTHQPALGPRGELWSVLLTCNP
jgi:hypothetical protein